jgi:hypothetical protein
VSSTPILLQTAKVFTRCAEHSSIPLIPRLWCPPSPPNGFVGKRSFYLQKNPVWKTGKIRSWQGDWGQVNWARKSESIRITLSDLDPQQVIIRETGHFQPCFPPSRPVNSPVFTSKILDAPSRLRLIRKQKLSVPEHFYCQPRNKPLLRVW